ncbi:outer membrane protein transport protein [Fusobacterium perfoetens]|uniref:OmpP1/FadL family transporter n=1 Tax=Fusobacterium perfoetens TaxID=852 RepID=UPI001F43C317|nr:outer membrane protein transport protein [Fusobacterium perfoetens]MCF2624924.1 outer membrane protein transport protein [Fusobacterium perfoetens]
MNLRKFGLITLIAALGTTAFGASIDHIQNYTAEYNANMAQQAAISPTTSAYYNPAGIMRLENGTYFTGGVQLAFGKETMKYHTNKGDGGEYSADLLAPIPNFALIKKQDDRAFFWTFGGIAGGGDLEYKDGVAGIKVLEDAIPGMTYNLLNAKDKGSWAEGENMYAQTTIGTAWNINNKLSMSVAGRVVYGWRNLKANLNADLTGVIPNGAMDNNTGMNLPVNENLRADIDSERTAWGFGGQIGLNYAYNDTWNFAMRYDTKVKMEFEADATSDKLHFAQTSPVGGLLGNKGFENFFPQYADGAKHRRDLPAILAVGASQKVTDKWTMFYGANYYFNESAKIDKDVKYRDLLTNKIKSTGLEYDNGWEISVGTEYWLNEKWAVLGGVNYAKTGAPKESYMDVEYALDSFLVGFGVKYRPNEDTEWVVSTSHYFYEATDGDFREKYAGVENAQRYDKNISSIGFSYTKKF